LISEIEVAAAVLRRTPKIFIIRCKFLETKCILQAGEIHTLLSEAVGLEEMAFFLFSLVLYAVLRARPLETPKVMHESLIVLLRLGYRGPSG
jgi:hypothetical protein